MQECGAGSTNRTSKRTLRTEIRPSQLAGAGNGLWLLEDARKDQVVAHYSGDVITPEETAQRIQVSSPAHPRPAYLTSLTVCADGLASALPGWRDVHLRALISC